MNILSIDPGKCKFGAAVVNDAGRILFRRIERVRESGDGGRAGLFDLIYAPLAGLLSEAAEAYGIELVTLGDRTASRDYLNAITLIIKKNERFGRIGLRVVDESHTTEAARALFHKHNPPFFLLRWLPYSMIPVLRDVDDFAAVAIALKYLKNKDF
jgi:RNase H-fold protein (predicted Holliday junction resolvase)